MQPLSPPRDEREAQIGVIQILRGVPVAEVAEEVHQGEDLIFAIWNTLHILEEHGNGQ